MRRVTATRRGTSMLECAVALVLTGMLSLELGRSLQAASALTATAVARNAAADVARNLLESETGAPCGPPYTCPADFDCTVSRSRGVYAGLDRLRASAARRASGQRVELSVLVRPPSCL